MSNSEIIWNYLKENGYSDYACAGILGNLEAESGLIPTNLQNSYNRLLGYSDEAYTKAVDNGSYKNFANDHAGYGLAQWTASSRKAGLLALKKKRGLSIGSMALQLEWLLTELKSYPKLKSATSVKEASNIMLLDFERPANQSAANQNRRAAMSQAWYNKYAGKSSGGSSTNIDIYKTGNYTVVVDSLRVRTGPGTNYSQKKFAEMTASAQKLNYEYKNTGLAFYKNGVVFTALSIEKAADGSYWAKTPSGYVCISGEVYCKKQ